MSEITPTPSMTESDFPSKSADQKFCFSCGTVLHSSATSCPKCGAVQPTSSAIAHIAQAEQALATAGAASIALPPNHVYCRGCGKAIHETAPSCPKCGALQRTNHSVRSESGKDRMTAALLALFLGGIGAHKFYLGRTGIGILYLLFFWTFIPALISFIEGIIFLTMSDSDFVKKY